MSQLLKIRESFQLPLPSRDRQLWHTTREDGFCMYPKRRENYERYKEGKREEILEYMPIMLDIENVSRCNYRCTMCQVSGWPAQRRARDMSFDEFKSIIDTQYGLIEVKIQGMGEPLLNSDFFRMIAYARQKSLWVRSTTNASLLHYNENYKHVLDSDICELQVSIDGTSQETYEAIRHGGQFDRVKENCVLLNHYGQRIGKSRTRMWVMVHRENFHELDAFPQFAAELGFTRLTFSLNLSFWGQEKWEQTNKNNIMHDQFELSHARDLVENGKKYGVDVTFWAVNNKYDTRDVHDLCPLPFQRVYISSDMRVVPCAGVANPDIVDFGDANELLNIWNGPELRAFRRAHRKGNLPFICKSCYSS